MSKVEISKVASLTGHKDCIYVMEPAGKSNLFFSSGGDGMIVCWNTFNPHAGSLIAQVPNSVYALHYMPDSGRLIAGQNFSGIHLIDVQEKKEVGSIKFTDSYIFDIKTSDRIIYAACGDGSLVLLDKTNLSVVSRLKISQKSARTIAFNPSLGIYAIGFSDNSIVIFSFKKNKQLYTINAHQNSIFTMAFSPDGRYLLSGSRDAHLKIWDCENNFVLHKSIVAHMFAINHIQFEENGDFFATCSMDKSIKIWDFHGFNLLKVIDRARHAGHATSVNRLLWPEKNTLISASDDKTITLWDIKFNR
jgi:WD40 repeat protein